MTVKVDNHNLPSKLFLRDYFLKKYHQEGSLDVMDCCQGNGLIWDTLKKKYKIDSYWGLDLKPKKARLKIDSSRVLAQRGWPQNIIDIDTYGSPWRHYKNMCLNQTKSLTCFLTIGQYQMGTAGEILEALSLEKLTNVPPGIAIKLHDLAIPYLLNFWLKKDSVIEEAQESKNDGSARYIGLRIVRKA